MVGHHIRKDKTNLDVFLYGKLVKIVLINLVSLDAFNISRGIYGGMFSSRPVTVVIWTTRLQYISVKLGNILMSSNYVICDYIQASRW